jgi:hypothetical protein
MDIHFLYFEDCPSHESGLERLKTVMTEEGIDEEIRITKVETDAQAAQWRFVGSPTILVNGEDIIPPPQDTPTMLTCRVYQLENGRYSPLPSPNMIRKALKNTK